MNDACLLSEQLPSRIPREKRPVKRKELDIPCGVNAASRSRVIQTRPSTPGACRGHAIGKGDVGFRGADTSDCFSSLVERGTGWVCLGGGKTVEGLSWAVGSPSNSPTSRVSFAVAPLACLRSPGRGRNGVQTPRRASPNTRPLRSSHLTTAKTPSCGPSKRAWTKAQYARACSSEAHGGPARPSTSGGALARTAPGGAHICICGANRRREGPGAGDGDGRPPGRGCAVTVASMAADTPVRVSLAVGRRVRGGGVFAALRRGCSLLYNVRGMAGGAC